MKIVSIAIIAGHVPNSARLFEKTRILRKMLYLSTFITGKNKPSLYYYVLYVETLIGLFH